MWTTRRLTRQLYGLLKDIGTELRRYSLAAETLYFNKAHVVSQACWRLFTLVAVALFLTSRRRPASTPGDWLQPVWKDAPADRDSSRPSGSTGVRRLTEEVRT